MPADNKVLALLLFMLCASTGANAQDMFVRPTNQPAHPVDLGIAVKPTAPAPAPVQPSAPVAAPPTQQIQQPQQRMPTPPPVQQVRPAPTQQPIPQPTVPLSKDDVNIITVNETPVSIPPGSGPNVFSVAIQPGTIGQLEVNEIYKSLGLNTQEIAANCTYENMVIITAGEVGSALTMGQTATGQTRFNGDLSAIDIIPTLACKKIRRPVSGAIIEQGPYYKVSATNINCPVPHGGSVALTFRNLGNGKGDCQYR